MSRALILAFSGALLATWVTRGENMGTGRDWNVALADVSVRENIVLARLALWSANVLVLSAVLFLRDCKAVARLDFASLLGRAEVVSLAKTICYGEALAALAPLLPFIFPLACLLFGDFRLRHGLLFLNGNFRLRFGLLFLNGNGNFRVLFFENGNFRHGLLNNSNGNFRLLLNGARVPFARG
jgi:hypothetical protein